MKYRFKGNDSEMKILSETEFTALSKAKDMAIKSVEIKLSAKELKLMKRLSKSVNNIDKAILKDYIKYSTNKLN
tara:strand:+ start:1090 stop:1311 length:222 start_codon:yes stop_codon:yes gene_type:complete